MLTIDLPQDPQNHIRQPLTHSGTARCLLPPLLSFILHEHHPPLVSSPRRLHIRRVSLLPIPPTVLVAACQYPLCWVQMQIDRRATLGPARCFRAHQFLLLLTPLVLPRRLVSCLLPRPQADNRQWNTPCSVAQRPPTGWPLRTNLRLRDPTDQARGILHSRRCQTRLDSVACRDRSLFRSIPRSLPHHGCHPRFPLLNLRTRNPDD